MTESQTRPAAGELPPMESGRSDAQPEVGDERPQGVGVESRLSPGAGPPAIHSPSAELLPQEKSDVQPRADARLAGPPPGDQDGEPHRRARRRGLNDGQFIRRSENAAPRNPALGRAVQVQAAVHLENVTGQAPIGESVGTGIATSSAGISALTPAGQGLGEQTAANGAAPGADPASGPFAARLLRGLSGLVNQRGGVMTMRLQPPQLGRLRIEMTIARGVVTAQFHPATQGAQALLQQSLTALRSALEGHGLTVERLTVHTLPPAHALAMRHDGSQEQPEPQQQHRDAAEGESRGRRDGHPDSSHPRFAAGSPRDFETFTISPPSLSGADLP